MAYNEQLAIGIRACLQAEKVEAYEQKMFGGLSFMVGGKMCCGIIRDNLMVRVGKDEYEKMLANPHCREMDFTGKALRGFVLVELPGWKEKRDLKKWVKTGVQFVNTLEDIPRKRKRPSTR